MIQPTDLSPFETLFEEASGIEMPLPPLLETLYGSLRFPIHSERPHVIGNFVTTLDGVVTLNEPGHNTGGDISGFNRHDQMLMGLLRAVADAIVVGAGTLRTVSQHLWTSADIYPSLASDYLTLRSALGKQQQPLNVIVTATGELDLDLPVFQSEEVPTLIVAASSGYARLRKQHIPSSTHLFAAPDADRVSAQAILEAVSKAGYTHNAIMLVEGGPRLMGDFFAEHSLDELFLTLAPQIAGRDHTNERLGLVAGKIFASEHPLWGRLVSVKRAESHLFLRYSFT